MTEVARKILLCVRPADSYFGILISRTSKELKLHNMGAESSWPVVVGYIQKLTRKDEIY